MDLILTCCRHCYVHVLELLHSYLLNVEFLKLLLYPSPGSVLVLSAKPLLTKHSTASLCKPARGYDVICLTPAGGHIVGRHHNASVLDAVRKMSQRSRSTKNCVAYGCTNVYDETARNAGITFHA